MLIQELMVQPPAVAHRDTPLAEVAQDMVANQRLFLFISVEWRIKP